MISLSLKCIILFWYCAWKDSCSDHCISSISFHRPDILNLGFRNTIFNSILKCCEVPSDTTTDNVHWVLAILTWPKLWWTKNNVSHGFRKPCFSSVVIVFVMWTVSNNHRMDGSIPGSWVACATVTLSTNNSHTVPTCPPGSSEIAEHGKSQFLLRFGDDFDRGYEKKNFCVCVHALLRTKRWMYIWTPGTSA